MSRRSINPDEVEVVRAKRRPGRPRLPPNVRKSERLRMRLSPAELEEIQRYAREENLPLVEYIRRRSLERHIWPLAIPKADPRHLDTLNGLGHELNKELILIYTQRPPFGLVPTLNALQKTVDTLRKEMEVSGKELLRKRRFR